MAISYVLPYPPSANRYWRTFRNRVVRSKEATNYIKTVRALFEHDPQSGNVSIELGVYRPRRAGDLDNSIKVVVDALKGVAYHDDSQVVSLLAKRFDDKANPRVEVVVRCL